MSQTKRPEAREALDRFRRRATFVPQQPVKPGPSRAHTVKPKCRLSRPNTRNTRSAEGATAPSQAENAGSIPVARSQQSPGQSLHSCRYPRGVSSRRATNVPQWQVIIVARTFPTDPSDQIPEPLPARQQSRRHDDSRPSDCPDAGRAPARDAPSSPPTKPQHAARPARSTPR